MTPAQLRAMLDAAMRRPWSPNGNHIQAPPFGDVATVRATDDRPWLENRDAIVATMNAADALVALWAAAVDLGVLDEHGNCLVHHPEDAAGFNAALRRLEELT